MQDLIKQIVDMDKKAREITEAAQQEKEDSEKEIAATREKIRNDYLARARKRIALNKPQEQAAADAAWQEKQKKYAEISEQLDGLYGEKGDLWVRTIVTRVTGSD